MSTKEANASGWFKSFDAVFYLEIERDERFKLNKQSLEKLKSEGVPSTVLDKLDKVKGREVEGERKFLEKMARKIGDEATAQYQSLILESAHKKEKGWEPTAVRVFESRDFLRERHFSQEKYL